MTKERTAPQSPEDMAKAAQEAAVKMVECDRPGKYTGYCAMAA